MKPMGVNFCSLKNILSFNNQVRMTIINKYKYFGHFLRLYFCHKKIVTAILISILVLGVRYLILESQKTNDHHNSLHWKQYSKIENIKVPYYRTWQNIGGVKYWRIWRIEIDSPKFNLPKICF